MAIVWLIIETMIPNLDKHEGRREAIMKFVEPIVERFQANLQTFHFFFEPNGLLLRLRGEDGFLTGTIKPWVEEKLTQMNASSRSVRIEADYSEERDYGQGWELALKIFEIGSRSSILSGVSQTGRVQLGNEFNEAKFAHCLLNQWGYSIDEEAVLHFNTVVERYAVIFSSINFARVQAKLPQIIAEMQMQYLQQIADDIRRRMVEPNP
jgi:hypothetical protein